LSKKEQQVKGYLNAETRPCSPRLGSLSRPAASRLSLLVVSSSLSGGEKLWRRREPR